MIFKGDNLEYEFLPAALEITEKPASPLGRFTIWIIFSIIIGAIAWSYIGKIDEVAEARGKMIPDGKIKVIQPLEAGVITAIHVKEGEKVKKGKLLMELDTSINEIDIQNLKKSLETAKLEKSLLEAQVKGENTSGIVEKEVGEGSVLEKEIVEFQKNLAESRKSQFKTNEEKLNFTISETETELKITNAELIKKEKEISICENQENTYKKLYENGVGAKKEWQDRVDQLTIAKQEYEVLKLKVEQAENQIKDAKNNLNTLENENKITLLNQIVEKEKEVRSVETELTKAQKKFEFQKLYSPVDGIISGIGTYTIGGVVTPAQPLISIVPDGTPLIIEAMVLNKDIGFVKVGQETEIKLDTFPFQKYGTVSGKIMSISVDAVEDKNLGYVYKINVKPDKLSMRIDGKDISFNPGMTVSVEAKTGKRRIIEFFLPLVKEVKESLKLR